METKHPLEKFFFCPVCGASRFEISSGKSKRCWVCGFEYFMNPSTSTVAVIINGRNELLVVRRSREPALGTLDLPGGFCDCGETAEQGVAREVFEETGLRVCSSEFLFSLPNVYPYSGFDVHTTDLFFLCSVESIENAHAMDDAGEVMWLPMDQIRPESFGLNSIRKGVIRILNKKNVNK
jgi:mutator protein MutT